MEKEIRKIGLEKEEWDAMGRKSDAMQIRKLHNHYVSLGHLLSNIKEGG